MKKLITLLILAMSVGCGASEDDAPIHQAVELGEAEQALFVQWPNGGLGTLEGVIGTDCGNSWSGLCDAPRDKILRFKFDFSRDQQFDTGILLSESFDFAATRVCNFLNTNGWDCKKVFGTTASNENVGGGSIGGSTTAGVTDALNFQSQIITVQNIGKLHLFNGCKITVSRSNLQASNGWSVRTLAEKERYIASVLQHEMYHCAGLGHGAAGTLMGPGLPSSLPAILDPTPSEATRLRQYGYIP